jgi:sphingomyelin phosphodiesterase
MKISRQGESKGCIRDGDVVYMYDHANILWASEDKYLELDNGYITATNGLPVSNNGLFIIEMEDFKYIDWYGNLTYK